MVSKITILELHMDSPRFGTTETVGDDVLEPASSESPEGPSFRRLFVTSLLVSVAAAVLARRLFGSDEGTGEDPIEIETDIDGTPVEVEH